MVFVAVSGKKGSISINAAPRVLPTSVAFAAVAAMIEPLSPKA
jgi:hypothetical protein